MNFIFEYSSLWFYYTRIERLAENSFCKLILRNVFKGRNRELKKADFESGE